MEITGKIIAVLPVQGGTSKNGNEWKKQEYVLETFDQYPKKVCFQLFGADRIEQTAIQLGEDVNVFFDIDSREYQGRWYTNINAWKVDHVTMQPTSPEAQSLLDKAPLTPPDFGPTNPVDDLPF